jgi:hypothetical protein
MLADVPMGESPIGGNCSVTTVVISDREKGDRLDGKLGSKSLGWLGETPVRSARKTSNSTGRSKSKSECEPVKPRKTSVHLKRMMAKLGSAEPLAPWRRPMPLVKNRASAANGLPGVHEGGMPGRNAQRKHGTTCGSPRRTSTAKASRINRSAAKSRCAHKWGG